MLFFAFVRYEQELVNPVKNLVSGELARALLIQVSFLSLLSYLVNSYFRSH